MFRLAHRTLVGQANDNQSAGTFTHPTKDIILLYSVSSEMPSETFLTYWREQFEYEDPQNSLEFHQMLERCLSTAERMGVRISFVGVGMIEEKVILAAYQGSVWLKRAQKVGQILHATSTLEIIEGKPQELDAYVLYTKATQNIQEVVAPLLTTLESDEVLTLIEQESVTRSVHEDDHQAELGMTVVSVQEHVAVHSSAGTSKPAAQEALESLQPLTPAEVERRKLERPEPKVSPFVRVVKTVTQAVVKVRQLVSQEIAQLTSRDVYVRRKHRKMLGSVLIFGVVLVFTVIGTFSYFRNRQQEQRRQVQAALQTFEVRLGEIRQLLAQDPFNGRLKTEQLMNDVEVQSQLVSQPSHVRKALITELAELRAFYESISGQEELPVLPTFFDLRYVQSNFLANELDATNNTLFFLDSGQRRILALDIEKKQPTMLPVGEFPTITSMVADERYLYFLADGMFRFTLGSTDVATLVENEDETIISGNSLELFGSYVYVMNKSRNNIFRYTTNDDQLDSAAAPWVQTSEAVDFATAQSFAIDGDIWLGTQDGQLRKFTSGREVEYVVTGLKDPFTSALTVFTKPDLQNLYVLEPANSRMVILSKNGEFLREVKSSTLAASTGIVASETLRKAFVLSGSLVYEINLN